MAKWLASIAMLAIVAGAFAQGSGRAEWRTVCPADVLPSERDYRANPRGYADDFCALAAYEPHKVKRQFDSMVRANRARNNKNRIYLPEKTFGLVDGEQLYLDLAVAERRGHPNCRWWVEHSFIGDRVFITQESPHCDRRKSLPTHTALWILLDSLPLGRHLGFVIGVELRNPDGDVWNKSLDHYGRFGYYDD